MLSERMLTTVVRAMTDKTLTLHPVPEGALPDPVEGRPYTLYVHVPFCERLCPYCSFNRFPFAEERAMPYFANLRKEMLMLKDLGYDFDSVYVGGGTPTIMIDELCDTIDLAKETFSIAEVSSETNPNHLIPEYLDKLHSRIQSRLRVHPAAAGHKSSDHSRCAALQSDNPVPASVFQTTGFPQIPNLR